MHRVIRYVAARPATMVLIAVASVYIATGTYGANQSRDTYTAAIAAWALGVHHTLNLSFLQLARDPHSVLWVVSGAHGAIVSNRFPGAVLLATPLYALIGGTYGPVPATIAAALAAAGACALMCRVLLHMLPLRAAMAATAVFAFATSNWSVSGRELWEHSGSALVIAAGMLALMNRRWILSGLAFGGAALFRPHLAIAAGVVFFGIILLERRMRPAIAYGIACVPGVAFLLLWNDLAYGRFTITGGYSDIQAGGRGLVPFLINLAGTFGSLERGLLVCSPVLLLSIIGIRQAWRTSSPTVRLLAIAGSGYLVSQLWLIRFSGGDGFVGYRTCLETLVFAWPLLAEAGLVGAKSVGSAVSLGLIGLSVAFFSSAAFVQGETNMLGVNPWTSWGPRLLAEQYGAWRVAFGAVIGLAAVLVTCAVVHRAGSAERSNSGLGSEVSADGRILARASS